MTPTIGIGHLHHAVPAAQRTKDPQGWSSTHPRAVRALGTMLLMVVAAAGCTAQPAGVQQRAPDDVLAPDGGVGGRPPVSSSGTVRGLFPHSDPTVDFSYTLPDGWETESSDIVHAADNAVVLWGGPVGNVYVEGCRGTPLDPPVGPTVDDLAAVWGTLPGFTATTPVDVTVDGYAGKRVDFTLPPYDQTECVHESGFLLWTGRTDGARAQLIQGNPQGDFWAFRPGQQRQWVLDVDGTRLVIQESSQRGTTPKQLADMDEFLASVQIG